ncbi:MAG: inosine/xanthosine triphosphatase [Pseudomonadota bacterium]
MLVVVASKNPVKVDATRKAFTTVFPNKPLDVVSVSTDSGVSDQPTTDQETRLGAINRARNAARARPDAEFCVGIEGGVEVIDDQLFAFAWMTVLKDQKVATNRSATLPLPPRVMSLMDEGLELGEANDQVFATHNSKQKGGAFGLLTDGKLTRGGIYTQTLIIALVPFTKDLYPQFHQD